MYNIIPLLLILICLSVIIAIISGKFSVLAVLDVENIQAEKEARRKERIISNRIKRNIVKYLAKLSGILRPLFVIFGNFLKSALNKLYYIHQKSGEPKIVDALFLQAEEFKRRGDLDAAEKKYIEIIGADSKNLEAFKELGRVYFEKKEFEEAKQTFEHILKLKKDDEEIYENLARIAKAKGDLGQARDEYLKSISVNKQNAQTYFNLAEIYRAMGKFSEAAGSLKKSLKIEPANPKYLDTMLEISIIIKDKKLASDTYAKLLKANPENNKLDEFKKQIDEL